MRNPWTWCLVLICLCFLVSDSCLNEERRALLDIYGVAKPGGHVPIGWRGNCCRWEGVTCNSTTGRVTGLEVEGLPNGVPPLLNATLFLPFQELQSLSLSNIDLQGCLPGAGFEVWSNLHKLEILNLSNNLLNDSTILSLDTLPSLRSLYLSENRITNAQILQRLRNKKMHALDLSWNLIVDRLSKAVCNVTSLQELNLNGNIFFGELPSCIGDLNSLEVLDVSYNLLTVRFPSFNFANMTSLAYLSLSHNQLEGMLSVSFFLKCIQLKNLGLSSSGTNFHVQSEALANMSMQLQVIELSNCNLNVNSGILHSLLSHQYGLQTIDLSNNNLSGNFPTWLIENNPNLSYLNLQNNSLVGPLDLPSKVNDNLVWLDASCNMLNNDIPVDISTKLPNLQHLNLSRNSFGGACPSLGYLEFLSSLDISYNNISDDIAECLGQPQQSLTALFISNNSFHGSLPELLDSTIEFVEYLVLKNNNISGEIPASICWILMLGVVDISNNRFTGSLPKCISQISSLYSLNLRGNHFSGSIPVELCQLQHLTFLDLSENLLSGKIPSLPNLTYLHLSKNYFNGTFPLPLSVNSNLKTIDLRYNQLGGAIPSSIAESFPELRVILLKGNLFQGMIPNQICHLKYLRLLDLSNNMLSQRIPSCLSSMGLLGDLYSFLFQYTSFNYSDGMNDENPYDDFNGTLSELDQEEFTTKSRQDYYKGNILNYMSGLDFSSNQLQGSIPESIGNMQWLRALNFSNNSFSGPIPDSLSNLSNLESLDLSHNSLAGRIPPELTALRSLEVFSVAYNNLSGPTLSTEGQFITFDESSYEGNPGLCGPPLLKSCSITPPSIPVPEMDDDHDRIGDLILFGSSALFYAIGFWTSLAVLYFKRSWRWALFLAVDRFADLLMVRIAILMKRFHST